MKYIALDESYTWYSHETHPEDAKRIFDLEAEDNRRRGFSALAIPDELWDRLVAAEHALDAVIAEIDAIHAKESEELKRTGG
jgi:hypothetical protein